MNQQVFLLVFFLLLSLALLWRLGWLHLQPSHSKAGVVRTTGATSPQATHPTGLPFLPSLPHSFAECETCLCTSTPLV
jgi:hypothetical protein